MKQNKINPVVKEVINASPFAKIPGMAEPMAYIFNKLVEDCKTNKINIFEAINGMNEIVGEKFYEVGANLFLEIIDKEGLDFDQLMKNAAEKYPEMMEKFIKNGKKITIK